MKKLLIFIITAFLLVATIALVKSAATVVINPAIPANGDSLTCSVQGYSDDSDFYWYKNGQEFRVDYGNSSVIDSASTNPGDEWKCVVYTPFGNKIGEASVKFPIYPAGSVVIAPSQPEDDDSLTCSVPSSTESFDYYWYKDGVQFKTEHSTSLVVSADDTLPGENWRCSVWTGSNRVGDAVAIIDPDSNGTVTINPEDAYTDDELKASVSNTGDYEYNWYKNDAQFKTQIAAVSTIDAADTVKHDLFTVEVYTPVYHKYVGNATIEILNSPPQIGEINAPEQVTAGDSFLVEFSAVDADNDDLSYYIYREQDDDWEYVAYGNSTTVETSANDVGTYTYYFYVTDGEDWAAGTKDVEIIGKGGEREIRIYNLDISALSIPGGNYLRIRNYAHSMSDVTLRVIAMEINEIKTFNMDIERNTVKLIPLDFNFEPGKQYTLKIDVISDNFVGKDYMLVEA